MGEAECGFKIISLAILLDLLVFLSIDINTEIFSGEIVFFKILSKKTAGWNKYLKQMFLVDSQEKIHRAPLNYIFMHIW